MSFANEVKEELAEVLPNARHCQLAELAALNMFGARPADENSPAGRKYFTLQKKTDMIYGCAEADLHKSCCRRAFVRGAFLAAGYVNQPGKGYNLEFVCADAGKAGPLRECLSGFGIVPKETRRKGSLVLYLKEAEAIADTLNVAGAHKTLLYLETLRVEKDVRNATNRKVNCETANIAKTAASAAKQIEDIEKIRDTIGLDALPAVLKEIALIRISHPENSLSELGQFCVPEVGKSGVNHRLRKLSEIAGSL